MKIDPARQSTGGAIAATRALQQWIARERPVMHLALARRLERIDDALKEARTTRVPDS